MLPLLDGARFFAPRLPNVSLIPLCAGHSGRHKASNVTLWSRSINRNDPGRSLGARDRRRGAKPHDRRTAKERVAANARQGAQSTHAHEADDDALQNQYDQPMGAIDCEELERTLAETVVHRLRRQDEAEPYR